MQALRTQCGAVTVPFLPTSTRQPHVVGVLSSLVRAQRVVLTCPSNSPRAGALAAAGGPCPRLPDMPVALHSETSGGLPLPVDSGP